jgi:hypothetical protein
MIDFKGHRFEKDIILTCVRWYLAYPLSYRNLEEMMEERGVEVDHSNIYRWVQKFTPQGGRAARPAGEGHDRQERGQHRRAGKQSRAVYGKGGMFSMPLRSRGTGRVPRGNLQGATNGVESSAKREVSSSSAAGTAQAARRARWCLGGS